MTFLPPFLSLAGDQTTQPRTYPLTKAIDEAMVDFIERAPEIELVASGRALT